MVEQALGILERSCDYLLDCKRYPPVAQKPAPLMIAHRGAWNLISHRENTLAAFQKAKALGLDGIELDVHFTRDGIPVIHHDPDLLRLCADPGIIAELTFAELRRRAPEVPTLEEVLALEGLIFMIEIKTASSEEQLNTLALKLSRLRAARDFFLLALDPDLVRVTQAFPANCWILVGQIRLRKLVGISVARGYAGVAGHILGMTGALISELHAHGQKAGAGFISSPNILNREHARGIDWAYTNAAESFAHE